LPGSTSRAFADGATNLNGHIPTLSARGAIGGGLLEERALSERGASGALRASASIRGGGETDPISPAPRSPREWDPVAKTRLFPEDGPIYSDFPPAPRASFPTSRSDRRGLPDDHPRAASRCSIRRILRSSFNLLITRVSSRLGNQAELVFTARNGRGEPPRLRDIQCKLYFAAKG